MKPYVAKNIKLVSILSIITTFIYSLLINSSPDLVISVIIFFIAAMLFWSILLGLETKALPILIIICIVLAFIYIFFKGGIYGEFMLFINALIFNTMRLFVLIGGIYYIIKDFVDVKVNIIFLPLYVMYYMYIIFAMIN